MQIQMMKMKIARVILVCILMGAAVAGHAEPEGGNGQRSTKAQLADMAEALGVSDVAAIPMAAPKATKIEAESAPNRSVEEMVLENGQEWLSHIRETAKAATRSVELRATAAVKKRSFKDILEEVYAGREPASDLSAAAPGRRFYLELHVQYRDGENAEFKDYGGRPMSRVPIIPDLVAMDPFWSGFVSVGDAVLTRMESFYFFDFKVVGATLQYHQILQAMSWPKGETPIGREMDVVEHGSRTLHPQQRTVITRMIGKRECRITFGFIVD